MGAIGLKGMLWRAAMDLMGEKASFWKMNDKESICSKSIRRNRNWSIIKYSNVFQTVAETITELNHFVDNFCLLTS